MENKRTNSSPEVGLVNQNEALAKRILKDNTIQYLFFKIDRLNRAAYLITSHISDEEPLKKTLRLSNLKMARMFNDFLTEGNRKARNSEKLQTLMIECNHVCQIVDLGKHAGLIGPMNADIISGEYADLAQDLLEYTGSDHSASSDLPHLSKDFFSLDIQRGNPKGHEEKQMSYRNVPEQKGQKEVVKDISKGHSIGQKDSISLKAKGRMDKIEALLKRKGESPIKDIYAEFKNVSKKTIQRDLNALMEGGKIMKKGEKRWSVYFLAT